MGPALAKRGVLLAVRVTASLGLEPVALALKMRERGAGVILEVVRVFFRAEHSDRRPLRAVSEVKWSQLPIMAISIVTVTFHWVILERLGEQHTCSIGVPSTDVATIASRDRKSGHYTRWSEEVLFQLRTVIVRTLAHALELYPIRTYTASLCSTASAAVPTTLTPLFPGVFGLLLRHETVP